MSQLSQDNRLISISDFSLGKDAFLLTAFEGTEYISSLFAFEITVLSEKLEITPEKVIGHTATVTLHNEQNRSFNGYISQFSFGEIKADNLREYKLTMVPWLWFLAKTNNSRIFQEKNTKEIVSEIFSDWGFTDFDFRAEGGAKREYCVQYNESDLDFISRLLAEEGIAYFFKHDAKKHTLYLVDKQNAFETCAETDLEYSKGSQPNAQINHWEHAYEFKKGQWTLNDYNFKEPTKNLIANTQTKTNFVNNGKYEHYEYPGLYETTLGSELVQVRLDAEEASRNTVKASSDCSSFYSGGRFNLKKHTTSSEKGEYVITHIHHKACESSYFSGDNGETGYSNQFICVPGDIHYRPAYDVSEKPVMQGPQSAVVVGPSGEEIYIDEYGRIKVQFIWDRLGKNDEHSSCYLRVVQSWAGNQWGSSFIPRIGHEVIVNFLDGDPDRPLVTGSVYNGKNKPPYSSKTQSGIKTRSTKGADASNFNELRFEDKKDSEQIFVHAEKNLDVEVENNETHTVDNDRTKIIKHDENSTIENDRNKTVNNNQTETIAQNKTIDVGKDHSETIGQNMTISVGKDLKESVSGKYTEKVTKEYGLQAKSITMQADDEIVLKTGSAKIVLKSNGDITLSGKNINIKGSGNVVIKGSKVSGN